MSSYNANENGNTMQPREFKGEGSMNMANTKYGDSNPFYSHASLRPKSEPSEDGLSLNVKNLFSGSLMSVGQSDVGRSCYDVTFMDGNEGTVIKTFPDTILGLPSAHTKENIPGTHLAEPAFRTPPPPPSLPSSSTPAAVLNKAKETKFKNTDDALAECISTETKGEMTNNDSSSSKAGAVRAGGRHHLIDIHGMAIFLRQSTRCLSCREACCLYVTGTISAQLAAVTQVKITCQKCHYTASQALLRPNQVLEQTNSQATLNSYGPDQEFMSKDSGITKSDKEIEKKSARVSPKSSKGKGSSKPTQLERNVAKVQQYPSRENTGSRKDAKSRGESAISRDGEEQNCNRSPAIFSFGNPQTNSTREWRGKSYFSSMNNKTKSSSLTSCPFPDITLSKGLSSLCDESTCCPNKVGTSLCPVTGILRHLSPSISNLQDLPQYSHILDKPEDLRHQRKTLSDEGHDPNKKGSYLAKLLQTKLHNNLSPIPSPCSLSSSPSSSSSISSSSMLSSCARSSSSPTASSTATPSNAIVHTAPSLLKLWSSQSVGQTLPLTSQMYSTVNTYNYKQPLSPADLQASFSMKRKLQEDVEESLRRVRMKIYSTKTPPQFDAMETDGCRSAGPSNVNNDSDILSDDERMHKLDIGNFLSENYLEYLQEKLLLNALGDSCSTDCQSGDLSVSTERTCRHDIKKCQDKRHHYHDTKNRKCCGLYEDRDHSHLQHPIADSKIESKAKAEGEDNRNSTPSSPSHEESSSCAANPRKKSMPCMLRPKLFLKLEKRQFRRRGKFDARSMHRWIKASSVPYYCCYDLNYHKRRLIKRSKISHQSINDKNDRPPSIEEPTENSEETPKTNGTDNIEDLNEFLDRKEKVETDEKSNNGNETDALKTEISRKVKIDQKQLEAVHNEHCAVTGWMKCQNIESKSNGNKGDCTCEKDKKKTKRRKNVVHDGSRKPGKFHDLLSSESDSDSEEGKLTIDFKEEET